MAYLELLGACGGVGEAVEKSREEARRGEKRREGENWRGMSRGEKRRQYHNTTYTSNSITNYITDVKYVARY